MMNLQNVKNIFMLLCSQTLLCNLFLLIINFQDCSNAASVKFLPGFDGPLPFHLETGNPVKDPLLLWFTGGPGCSSISALVYEIGPITLVPVQYDGRLPKLVLNPFSWTKIANIIFLDLPVGTGFSYARNTKAAQSDILKSSEHAYEFLRKWLVDHPRFLSNQFYVAGDSYSGLIVPIITQLISDGNDKGLEPKINLKGYVLGNPISCPDDNDYVIQYAHGMGLISDELFELLLYIYPSHILEPVCSSSGDATSRKLLGGTRTLYEKYHSESNLQKLEIIHEEEDGSLCKCRPEKYLLVNHWANDENVQEAIHIRKGTIGEWNRCNDDLKFTKSIRNSVPYHANLSIKGYRSLIYSGDHDMVVPFISTEAWIKSLNYSIVDDWRPWIVDGQVAGYTRSYANRMTFATVKGGGHVAPEYKPPECMAMLERWISNQPL